MARAWAGVLFCAGADILYVSQVATGDYTDPALLNAMYLLSFSLLAVAGWVPSRRTAVHMSRRRRRSS